MNFAPQRSASGGRVMPAPDDRPAMLAGLLVLLCLLALTAPAHAAEPELLDPDQAFRFSARIRDERSIEVNYAIAPGYYLYRGQFRFAIAPPGASLGAPAFPRGEMKRDEFFGESEIYRGAVSIVLPLKFAGPQRGELTLTAISQGCADVGVCYVPQEQTARLLLASAAAGGEARSPPLGQPAQPAARPRADDDRIAGILSGGFWASVASFFGFGLLLAFTPCVLPMVPILSGIIVGGGHPGKMRGFLLAAAYVLGMALTYATAGVAAGLSGALLAATLQNPWVLGGFGLVFVALALAMLGLYDLQLPVAMQSRLADVSNLAHGGRTAGVFAMGILSALIMGPCVAAPLAGALLYIGQTRDVALGGAALFAMALGMGAPLLLVGASAGALLPKSGPWMETVKRFFGVVLLGMAVYVVSPVLPVAVQMGAWAALLIITAIFLRAIDPLPPNARAFDRFSKGVGVIALVTGLGYAIGALSGSRDLLQPLAGLRLSVAAAQVTPFQRVGSLAELEARLAQAGKPVMLDFYADWCVSCKEMERFTFSDDRVRQRLEHLLLLQADVTGNTADHAALLKRFRLFGPPGIVFFDAHGREIQGLRVIGFQPAEQFAAVLDRLLSEP